MTTALACLPTYRIAERFRYLIPDRSLGVVRRPDGETIQLVVFGPTGKPSHVLRGTPDAVEAMARQLGLVSE